MDYIIEVFGSFGIPRPGEWKELRREATEQEARQRCNGLTGGHYFAARVRHNGVIIHQSGGEVVAAAE